MTVLQMRNSDGITDAQRWDRMVDVQDLHTEWIIGAVCIVLLIAYVWHHARKRRNSHRRG